VSAHFRIQHPRNDEFLENSWDGAEGKRTIHNNPKKKRKKNFFLNFGFLLLVIIILSLWEKMTVSFESHASPMTMATGRTCCSAALLFP